MHDRRRNHYFAHPILYLDHVGPRLLHSLRDIETRSVAEWSAKRPPKMATDDTSYRGGSVTLKNSSHLVPHKIRPSEAWELMLGAQWRCQLVV
jgi:hypothetical protein